jgi:predicted LPLAT superfamily acyltransferase
VLYGVAAYYVVFAPQARQASRRYLRRALGRWANWRDGFLHVLSFASTVHDRVYLLNDRFDQFEIEVHGAELLQRSLAERPGALLIGAHLGSFEVLRSVGRGREGLKVAMLMYEENARKINAALEAINPAATADIIALGQPGSMMAARDRLDQGYLVGMLADRRLGEGEPVERFDFLGAPAPFPVGPFRVAAMLQRPVFFMTGLYMGGRRYHIHFEPLADFTGVERAGRADAIRAAQQAYADRLSHFCRQAPYNWFNFFDFWQDT